MKLLVLIFFLFHSVVQAKEKDAFLVYKNNKAAKKLLAMKGKDDYIGQSFDAYQTFVALTGQWPFDLTLQFNLGSTLAMNSGKEDSEKVENYFLDVIKHADQVLVDPKADEGQKKEATMVRLAATYNLGVYYHMAKNVGKALEYYQKALDIASENDHPGPLEIKTNIELLAPGPGEGEGEGEQKEGQDQGDQDKESKDGKGNKDKEQKEEQDSKDKDKEKKDKPSNEKNNDKKKPFDQKQMSMEDLKRIMDELKQQEQAIRAKTQGKGSPNESREKDW